MSGQSSPSNSNMERKKEKPSMADMQRREEEGNKLGISLLMEILSPTALGMGQMEQENLKQFIAECVRAHECEFPC